MPGKSSFGSPHRTCLVIPTIREKSYERFTEEWDRVGLFDEIDMIVVEDNPSKTFTTPTKILDKTNVFHFDWLEIDADLRANSWIIPRRSDCVRSFGYFKAWQMRYTRIITLDDDCYPVSGTDGRDFVFGHFGASQTTHTRWFNTLDGVKPRGIPFYNRGWTISKVNHGLWQSVLDYDAPTQLVDPKEAKFDNSNAIVPSGQYFPMCGMNLSWESEVTVLMYHLLMGQIKTGNEGKLTKLPFDRFGDIWCGIFMKKIADGLEIPVSTGTPYIHHDRASNPFTNLKKEANGLEVNEKLWEYVDEFPVNGAASCSKNYSELGNYISRYDEFPEHVEYFQKLGEAMQVWASLFSPGSR